LTVAHDANVAINLSAPPNTREFRRISLKFRDDDELSNGMQLALTMGTGPPPSSLLERAMRPTVPLLNRVRSEFIEMPGLRLRVDQAQRLWNLDRASCEMLLSSLVEANFLKRYSDEAYGLPSTL
jgi:hypothetical protein